jgi:cell division protein FtsA
MVNREIIASGCAEILGGGVVLTGGTTLLEGVVELAEFVFDLPVKRAYPENVSGFSDMVRSPAYSTAVGLALWGAESRSGIQRRAVSRANNIGKMKDQLKNFLSEMF